MQPGNMARLSITIAQAKLTKNYGLTKMDPYCRVRVGHSVFETQTAVNGSKNPRWNKTVYCCLPPGVDTVYIEIFDERAFTMDDRVAWAHVAIAPSVRQGETVDDWYPLSGKQGEEKEGSINLVLSYTETAQYQAPVVYATPNVPVMVLPGGAPVYYPPQQVGGAPVTVQQQPPLHQMAPPRPPPGPLYTEEDIKQVKEMFPAVDDEVIKSVLEANRGNKDLTINNLLSMNS